MSMDLFNLKKGYSRSISAENFTGEPNSGGKATTGTGGNAARELGAGWKVSPSVEVKAGETFTLCDITDSGIINHIWITCEPSRGRDLIFRAYWDNESEPSILVPLTDFFCNAFREETLINSAFISVNPRFGMNSYWQMPFRKQARMDITNTGKKPIIVYYSIDYTLQEVPDDAAYLHASFRRENPLKTPGLITLVSDIEGSGQYVGTYLGWKVNNPRWWGEGEIKFYIDDDEYPTICGTGTEDYFGGAWNYEFPRGEYGSFSTPYLGMVQSRWKKRLTKFGRVMDYVFNINGLYKSGARFNQYRWHAEDAIRFYKNLRVEIQDLGWKGGGLYLAQQSDISATTYWYQLEPHKELKEIRVEDLS